VSVDPDGARLPVKIDTASNGEFAPIPLTDRLRHARRLAHERVTAHAKRVGVSRRQFLKSSCGVATTLLALNEATADTGTSTGAFDIDPAAALDAALADHLLTGDELIFDVQTHHVDPTGPWRSPLSAWNITLRAFPQAQCGDGFLDRLFGSVDCFSARHFTKEIFLDSDTDIAVLSFVPATDETTPLTLAAADETRRLVDAMDGDHRLLLHGRVNPNGKGEVERMPEILDKWKISAWKSYTQFGPEAEGYFLDDETYGVPFLEAVRKTDCKIVCVHKGLPLFGFPEHYSRCRDIGPAAKRFGDVTFLVYHSGYEPMKPEGPYRESADPSGINGLIQSLIENDIPQRGNVYAELGSTWRFLMRDPTSAAHSIGKLLKYVGEDRVIWGTDSIWYGSPQDQIQSFRAFQIPEAMRSEFGYPEITDRIRRKIFGLNALVPYGIDPATVKKRASTDRIQEMKAGYAEAPDPSFVSYGPKTAREYRALLKHEGQL